MYRLAVKESLDKKLKKLQKKDKDLLRLIYIIKFRIFLSIHIGLNLSESLCRTSGESMSAVLLFWFMKYMNKKKL